MTQNNNPNPYIVIVWTTNTGGVLHMPTKARAKAVADDFKLKDPTATVLWGHCQDQAFLIRASFVMQNSRPGVIH